MTLTTASRGRDWRIYGVVASILLAFAATAMVRPLTQVSASGGWGRARSST